MRKILVLIAALTLSACASFDARLVAATKIHTQATRSVTTALDASLITSKDAESFEKIATESSAVLDSARVLKDTDAATAEDKLNLAQSILLQLQRYLTERQK